MPFFSGDEVLLVKKLSPEAILPIRGSKDAAGFDLSAAHSSVVPAGGMSMIKTDLAIATPPGTYGRVAPRSGLALKKSIATGAGVIDADYRGNVGVILFNHGKEDFVVNHGDRVAQLVLERVCMASAEEVKELPETARSGGGFGSTGISNFVAQSPTSTDMELLSDEGQNIVNDMASDIASDKNDTNLADLNHITNKRNKV